MLRKLEAQAHKKTKRRLFFPRNGQNALQGLDWLDLLGMRGDFLERLRPSLANLLELRPAKHDNKRQARPIRLRSLLPPL